jgi:hypothetical protein
MLLGSHGVLPKQYAKRLCYQTGQLLSDLARAVDLSG